MRIDPKQVIKVVSILAIVAVIGGYSYYKSKNLLDGPSISITNPNNGTLFEQTLINIEGVVNNATHISINDRPITMDEGGNFKERIMLSPGYNVMKLSVKDRFGREKDEILELVLKETEPAITASESKEVSEAEEVSSI